MLVVPCTAPTGTLEPAPLTSLQLGSEGSLGQVAAFWTDEGEYRLRVMDRETGDGAARWLRIEATSLPDAAAGASVDEAVSQLRDVIPMGGGRAAFPVGSTGRTVYRVWRSSGRTERPVGRTRILGVRAGRSLRRPA